MRKRKNKSKGTQKYYREALQRYGDALFSTGALRSLVERFFNQYKYYWISKGVDWDYRIYEREDEKGGQVEVKAGLKGTNYVVLFDAEFQKSNSKAHAYLRILGDLGCAGCAKVWQDTVGTSTRSKNVK